MAEGVPVARIKLFFTVLISLCAFCAIVVYYTSIPLATQAKIRFVVTYDINEDEKRTKPESRDFRPSNKRSLAQSFNRSTLNSTIGNPVPRTKYFHERVNELQIGQHEDSMRQPAMTSLSERNGCPNRQNVSLEDKQLKHIPQDLIKLAPDVFKQFPKNFVHGYNSPCWEDSKPGNQKNILCLPKFFLAGVAKCGTTDIWMKINCHPLIVAPREKEPSWWTRKRLGRGGRQHGHPSDLLSYVKEFHKLSSRIMDNSPNAHKLISGDGSPSTYWDNVYWHQYVPSTCKQGPTYVIADVIHAVLPQTKILVILRNPTDRLYSDYMFTGGSKRTPQTFHNHVLESTTTFNSCLKTGKNTRACIYNNFRNQRGPIGHRQSMMLMKGLYSVHAREWLDAFPRDQLMFIRFEDWYTNCRDILPVIFNFLELDALPSANIGSICAKKNPTKKKNRKGPMLNETRTILDKFYQATRNDLAKIMQDDRFLWNEWT